MPILPSSYNRRPWYLFSRHLETVVPFLVDESEPDLYTRERMELDDGDFLDLDWIKTGSNRLLILSHGIEGNSQSYYVKRAAKYFSDQGWDILAWNFRSCGGEINRTEKFYHAGETEDLSRVISKAIVDDQYESLVLVGYSMGGHMTLKYLGERTIHPIIKGAVTFSVPCNLKDILKQFARPSNRLYEQKSMKKIREKIRSKPALNKYLNFKDIEKITSLKALNEYLIFPMYGFKNSEEYCAQCSCEGVLEQIDVPVYIGNAANDPLLGKWGYPTEQAGRNPNIHLEIPRFGGHLGFTPVSNEPHWMNQRTRSFLDEVIFSGEIRAV